MRGPFSFLSPTGPCDIAVDCYITLFATLIPTRGYRIITPARGMGLVKTFTHLFLLTFFASYIGIAFGVWDGVLGLRWLGGFTGNSHVVAVKVGRHFTEQPRCSSFSSCKCTFFFFFFFSFPLLDSSGRGEFLFSSACSGAAGQRFSGFWRTFQLIYTYPCADAFQLVLFYRR